MAQSLYIDTDYIVDNKYVQVDIVVNWATREIFVPKFKSTIVQTTPLEIRQLNLNEFRLTLKELESDADGITGLKTNTHNTTVTVGGVTLARVIEIVNNYTVTFEEGQYAINLVGANSNVGDVVNVNQVSVRSSNSAGLQDLSTLLASAYQGQVVVNGISGQEGTATPLGTFLTPSKFTSDAILIAADKGVRKLYFDTPTVLLNEDLSAGYKLVGGSPHFLLDARADANLTGCSIENLTITGELDGLNVLQRCNILDITNVSGFAEKCNFSSTCTINGTMIIMECYADSDSTHASFTVSGGNVSFLDFHGSMSLSGIDQGDHVVEVSGGSVTLDNTNTAGTIHVTGEPSSVIDNTGPGCTVLIETNSSQGGITEQDKLDIAQDVWEYVI